jgi:WD40 repeat protein
MTDLRDLLHAQAATPREPLDTEALFARVHRRSLRARLAAWLAALVALGAIGVPVEQALQPARSGTTVHTVQPRPGPLPDAPTVKKTTAPPAAPGALAAGTVTGASAPVRVDRPAVGGVANPSEARSSPPAVASTEGRIAYRGADGRIYVRAPSGATTAVATGFDPRWSPDGRRLMYWTGTGDTATCDNDFWYGGMRCTAQIDVVNADGTGQRTLVNSGLQGDWSPDGTHIVYVVGGPQATATGSTIWIANADGSRARRLTSGDDRHPRWSPDGSTIAFDHNTSQGTGGGPALFTIHVDGTGLTEVPGSSQLTSYQPAWSPDSRRLAFAGYDYGLNRIDVYVVDLVGGNGAPTRVTNSPGGSTYIDNMDYAPTWSPDGAHLAYTSDPDGASGTYWCDAGPTTGCPVGGSKPGTVFEINADGTGRHALATGSNAAYAPR